MVGQDWFDIAVRSGIRTLQQRPLGYFVVELVNVVVLVNDGQSVYSHVKDFIPFSSFMSTLLLNEGQFRSFILFREMFNPSCTTPSILLLD